MRTLLLTLSLLLGCHRESLNGGVAEAARDESCRRCLAQGRTWQGEFEGGCTVDCDFHEIACHRDSCPGTCSRKACENCLDASACRAASCAWKQAGATWACAEPADQQPSPECQEQRTAQVQREGTSLVVTMKRARTCLGTSTNDVVVLARAELEQSQSCPAGELFVEDLRGDEPQLALSEFGERLEREAPQALGAVEGAVTVLSETRGVRFARAFIVGCSEPTFLLFGGGAEPRAQILRVSRKAGLAPPASTKEPQVDQPSDPTGSSDLGEEIWTGRELATGEFSGPSSLKIWKLGRTGTTAKLLIQECLAPKIGPSADEQPQGLWSCRQADIKGGFATSALSTQGGVLRFPGRGDNIFQLHCSIRAIPVAPETARRVRSGSGKECKASRWNSSVRRPTKVLVCSSEVEAFFLAQGAGVEHVTFDDECVEPLGALRAIPRDGGVAAAVRFSEQPRSPL